MALHTTTHDQIFLSYLVSSVLFEFFEACQFLIIFRDYESGGLNLNAAHFAQLSVYKSFAPFLQTDTFYEVALMSFVQIAYQFYLYP